MREKGFTKIFILALFLVAAIAFSVTPSEAKKGKGHHGHGGYGATASLEDVEHVVVKFTGYTVKTRSGEVIDVTYRFPREIDLMEMGDDVSEVIFDVDLSEGKYRRLRLKVLAERGVIDSYVEMISGERHSLKVPSGKRTGLKLIKGFKVSESGRADFAIKFNLRKSVRAPRGEDGNYILRPTLKLVKRHDDDVDSDGAGDGGDDVVVVEPGSISGAVNNFLVYTRFYSCEGTAAVYLFEGASIVPDDIDGIDPDPVLTAPVVRDDVARLNLYSFDSVVPGEYTVAYICDASSDDPAADELLEFSVGGDVTVVSGVNSVLNF